MQTDRRATEQLIEAIDTIKDQDAAKAHQALETLRASIEQGNMPDARQAVAEFVHTRY